MPQFTRWTNQSLPQTLQYGMYLLYIDAVFGVIRGSVFFFPLGTLVVLGSALAGAGIANEYKWGWRLGVGISAFALIPAALIVLDDHDTLFNVDFLIAMVFPVAQFALLVHPHSRSHQKIWFH